MYRRDQSHLEEWATLLDVDVCEELLDDEPDTWIDTAASEQDIAGDEAR